MLLMGLNIGLVLSSIVSFGIRHSIPQLLAITCGAIGGVTLYSRIKTWKTGTAKYFYNLVRDNEEATKKMRNFDYAFSALGVFNVLIFLWSLAR